MGGQICPPSDTVWRTLAIDMLADLDDALGFLRDFHAGALAGVQGLRVNEPTIPAALRRVYATFGEPQASSCPIGGQDSLKGPSELRRTGDFIHFLDENQGCWSCAYCVDGGEDPAVFLFEDGEEPVKQGDSLERFLVTYLLQESVMSAPHFASQEDGVLPEDALRAAVEPLWLAAVYSRPNPTHWFYWCKDAGVLAMRFDGDYAPWLWLGAQEDRWESVLRDCQSGYMVSGPARDDRCVGRMGPSQSNARQLPKWLRWLE